jgi:hypothetical protein
MKMSALNHLQTAGARNVGHCLNRVVAATLTLVIWSAGAAARSSTVAR